jgi:hypothetical protein
MTTIRRALRQCNRRPPLLRSSAARRNVAISAEPIMIRFVLNSRLISVRARNQNWKGRLTADAKEQGRINDADKNDKGYSGANCQQEEDEEIRNDQPSMKRRKPPGLPGRYCLGSDSPIIFVRLTMRLHQLRPLLVARPRDHAVERSSVYPRASLIWASKIPMQRRHWRLIRISDCRSLVPLTSARLDHTPSMLCIFG